MKNKYLILGGIGLALLFWIFMPPSFNSLGILKLIHFQFYCF